MKYTVYIIGSYHPYMQDIAEGKMTYESLTALDDVETFSADNLLEIAQSLINTINYQEVVGEFYYLVNNEDKKILSR